MKNKWSGRTIALEELENWRGMLGWYRKWTKNEPKNANDWVNIGNNYNDLKRYADAVEAYRQALHIEPKNADAQSNGIGAYIKLNRDRDAIGAFRHTLLNDPKNADAWLKVYTDDELRSFDVLVEIYRRDLRINPEDDDVWYNLGLIYSNHKLYNDAIEPFRQTLRIDPEYATAWYLLGSCYYISGNREASLDAIWELRRLDPEIAYELFNLIVTPDSLKKTEVRKDSIRQNNQSPVAVEGRGILTETT